MKGLTVILSVSLFFLCVIINAQDRLLVESNLIPVDYGLLLVNHNEDLNKNNNIVKVTQVGGYNYSNVVTQNSISNIKVEQTGYNNYLDIYKNGGDNNQSIVQFGNNNYISDFSLNTGYSSTNINYTQKGDNLTLISNGSNSISKDLKVVQTGNSGVVYIYNH